MSKLHLIMPMGGAGSRFFENGYEIPKPLIDIQGMPFFYWATQSIVKYVPVLDLTFVVLQEHVNKYDIINKIKNIYKDAKIVIIPEILPGAVLTCLAGIGNIDDDYPVLFNDCDHMFECRQFYDLFIDENLPVDFDGALLTFISDKPQFSYVKYDDMNNIIGTVEKIVASDHAICGAYTFKNASIFKKMAETYLNNCKYSEFYVSGLYNEMCKNNLHIIDFCVDFHTPFGTPEEYYQAQKSNKFERLK